MLEKPAVPDQSIRACLLRYYRLPVITLTFLPIGADAHTAVYHATTLDGTAYFVKLRAGPFNEAALWLTQYLSEQDISAIIPPLPTQDGALWAELDEYRLLLSPFIAGHNAYQTEMTSGLWRAFGAALRRIHAVELPPELRQRIRREDYTPQARHTLRTLLRRLDTLPIADENARQLAQVYAQQRALIDELIDRAENLAAALQASPPPFVLCHSDLHAGNLLIGSNGALYIVDWDEPVFAPRERDLMYIGGAQGFRGCSTHEEEALFYPAYGAVSPAPDALTYYRCERIVQDLAIYGEQLLLSGAGGADRAQALRFACSNFLPGNTIEAALGRTIAD